MIDNNKYIFICDSCNKIITNIDINKPLKCPKCGSKRINILKEYLTKEN